MNRSAPSPLSGRRAEAARNDQRILDSARAVFIADPGAPIAAVAEHAGVGISALYRRYRSKEELIQCLCRDALRDYIAEAEAALADEGDSWQAFVHFMQRAVAAGAASLTVRFAGTFSPTQELQSLGHQAFDVTKRLLDRLKAAGKLRADVDVGDIGVLLEQIQLIQVADPNRTDHLRHRFLILFLDALRTPTPSPLPGPARNWTELRGRYDISRQ
jgi:AcrR family transcriptional regulator